MKNTLQEQQHQSIKTAKSANTPQQAKPETPSWQLYFIMGVIAVGVLVMLGKVFGIF